MSKWTRIISGAKKPKKSLEELKQEVENLKKARENVKSYGELQDERKRIMQEIRREGFKQKHKKALSLLNKAKLISTEIAKDSYKIATSKQAKKAYKKLK